MADALPLFEALRSAARSKLRLPLGEHLSLALRHRSTEATVTSMSRPQPQRHDVVIMGGGLAGLTLALQLQSASTTSTWWCWSGASIRCRMRPTRSANRRSRSARTTSTPCWASSRIWRQQLRKFGFRFFFSEGRRDIDQVTEVGASRLPRGAQLPDRPRHLRELPGRGSRPARRELHRRRLRRPHRTGRRTAAKTIAWPGRRTARPPKSAPAG